MTTTTASSDVIAERSMPPGASARCRNRLIGPAAGQRGEHEPEADQAALDDAPAMHVLAVGVEQQDAGHDAEPERQDDDHEVLRAEAQRLARELRAEDAQDADQRRGDAEVDERPGDPPMAADEVESPSRSCATVSPAAVPASPGTPGRVPVAATPAA